MTLARRDFSIALLGASLGGAIATSTARAQPAAPVEGVHYVRVEPPLPPAAPGKIEVIEFFWYECPHCNAFEPPLEAWAGKLPADLVLRRVPVWFQEVPFAAQQRLYYTIEILGLVATLHRRVFAAIHDERTRLRTPEDMAAFALKNGVNPIRFMATFGSPEVLARTQQAGKLAEAYGIDAVPSMGVQGRFTTNGTLANAGLPAKGPAVANERMLGVVDTLVGKVRKAA